MLEWDYLWFLEDMGFWIQNPENVGGCGVITQYWMAISLLQDKISLSIDTLSSFPDHFVSFYVEENVLAQYNSVINLTAYHLPAIASV